MSAAKSRRLGSIMFCLDAVSYLKQTKQTTEIIFKTMELKIQQYL